ncbi:hypothetical protein P389DRAFT_72328 [Cystobasidium minutum MCA 4210]|uniref:uncharacterized protein n=1 Tax=Cystobasidium minutum MCA 4210 TaxID=1397322 RepID=UPI0034CFD2FE|eukprot:jgi/Rhomi1/72328/CE72327_56
MSDSQLHQALLGPWVLGVSLQAIFMGVVASQSHNLYLGRAYLPWKIILTTLLLFLVNTASFSAQTGTLWFFSMSSLGDIRYVISQFPLSLLVDLWLTPVTMATCNFVQARYAYKASSCKAWVLCIAFTIWVTEVASSIVRMVYTTMSFCNMSLNYEHWTYMSYLHLTSRLAGVLIPACLRIYFSIVGCEMGSGPWTSRLVATMGLIFRSGLLGAIPAAVEAATVLQEKRLSIAANIAYACTPRICASAMLASFLYVVQRKEAAAEAEASETKMQEIAIMPVLDRPPRAPSDLDSIELV